MASRTRAMAMKAQPGKGTSGKPTAGAASEVASVARQWPGTTSRGRRRRRRERRHGQVGSAAGARGGSRRGSAGRVTQSSAPRPGVAAPSTFRAEFEKAFGGHEACGDVHHRQGRPRLVVSSWSARSPGGIRAATSARQSRTISPTPGKLGLDVPPWVWLQNPAATNDAAIGMRTAC